MPKLTRIVWPEARMLYGPARELVPDLKIAAIDDGAQPVELMALSFASGDEANVYLLNEQGREALIRMLTGGVIVPGP